MRASYNRVSTVDQTRARQLDGIEAAVFTTRRPARTPPATGKPEVKAPADPQMIIDDRVLIGS